MAVKIVKLISGEELIGDVFVHEITATIKQPCVIQMVPGRTDPNNPMLALIPYAMYTMNHSVDVDVDKIIWEEEPVKELYNQYNSIFGSGIQLATL